MNNKMYLAVWILVLFAYETIAKGGRGGGGKGKGRSSGARGSLRGTRYYGGGAGDYSNDSTTLYHHPYLSYEADVFPILIMPTLLIMVLLIMCLCAVWCHRNQQEDRERGERVARYLKETAV